MWRPDPYRELRGRGTEREILQRLLTGRARTRGGVAAAAACLEQDAHLTTDPSGRAERVLAAAKAHHQG
jgi:hypothetical protein